ncbi:MAG: hypothetical protein AAF556_12995, partial [Pseudomonadota bacterium]
MSLGTIAPGGGLGLRDSVMAMGGLSDQTLSRVDEGRVRAFGGAENSLLDAAARGEIPRFGAGADELERAADASAGRALINGTIAGGKV